MLLPSISASLEPRLSPPDVVHDLVIDGVLGQGCLEASDSSLLRAGLVLVDGGESKFGREGVEPRLEIPSSLLQISRPDL